MVSGDFKHLIIRVCSILVTLFPNVYTFIYSKDSSLHLFCQYSCQMIKVLFNALLRSLKYVFILGWFFLSNIKLLTHMDVSENNGFSPQIIHLSIINSIHFGVFPYFWFNTHLKHGKAVRLPSREFYETNGSPTGGTPQPAACVTVGPKRRKKPLSG